ncbi:hypothetical protein L596_017394 [Steinernema carpocapsae]|uniref:Nucleosome assembly protein n=1 Tax=Steinernema carpocapsae TaxID=34508 RepID=A0A4U5N1W6_STECR|nr:hypothetical protein L596_017394 [Steinernema carpocapsae]
MSNPKRASDASDVEDALYTIPEHMKATTKKQRFNARALKKLQVESIKIEAEHAKQLHFMEVRFQERLNEIYEQRKLIINGEKTPTEEEANFPLFNSKEKNYQDAFDKLEQIWNEKNLADDVKGIPNFWLNVLLNYSITERMISLKDRKALAHLTDIKCTVDLDKPAFVLHFHFSPNSYFENDVLEKRYNLSYAIDAKEPLDYDGLTIDSTTATSINWKNGNNFTKKVVQKNLRHITTGKKRIEDRTVKTDSFFNFFEPPSRKFADTELSAYNALMADYEVGQLIRENIVPRAVLFYLGEYADVYIGEDCDDYDEKDEGNLSHVSKGEAVEIDNEDLQENTSDHGSGCDSSGQVTDAA